MSWNEFQAAVSSMTPAQFEAVRVCIMAERRLRTLYPRDPASGPALSEAYAWALEAKPGPMVEALR